MNFTSRSGRAGETGNDGVLGNLNTIIQFSDKGDEVRENEKGRRGDTKIYLKKWFYMHERERERERERGREGDLMTKEKLRRVRGKEDIKK